MSEKGWHDHAELLLHLFCLQHVKHGKNEKSNIWNSNYRYGTETDLGQIYN